MPFWLFEKDSVDSAVVVLAIPDQYALFVLVPRIVQQSVRLSPNFIHVKATEPVRTTPSAPYFNQLRSSVQMFRIRKQGDQLAPKPAPFARLPIRLPKLRISQNLEIRLKVLPYICFQTNRIITFLNLSLKCLLAQGGRKEEEEVEKREIIFRVGILSLTDTAGLVGACR